MGNKTSSPNLPPLVAMQKFIDIERFMGTWYVIACKPTYFEIGAHNAVEKYSWNKKQQQVDIDFEFNKENGPAQKISQTGYIYNDKKTEWRLSPFWPIKLPYLIIELDEDYSYTVIGYPSRDYLWIMARSKEIDNNLYEELTEKLKNKHSYDLSGLVKIPHD
jgi:apolipoprotein D and lipocalin family protein